MIDEHQIIIIGAGGHAKVAIDTLNAMGVSIIGITDQDSSTHGSTVCRLPVLGDDHEITKYPTDRVRLVNGVGSTRVSKLRQRLFQQFQKQGYVFHTLIHPSAIIGTDASLGEGVQIMAGAIVQPECRLGDNIIVNTGAQIDHDCIIGNHVHIAPGAILSSGVRVGKMSHVGAGATVIQNITIGDESMIAAGAVVVRDVPNKAQVAGVPANLVKYNELE